MSVKQVILIGLGGLLGAILLGLFNYGLLDSLLIPDPCYYHNHETNWLFDMFYTKTAAEGFHPSPSVFNLAFTFFTGLLIGGWLTRRGIKAWQKKQVIASVNKAH